MNVSSVYTMYNVNFKICAGPILFYTVMPLELRKKKWKLLSFALGLLLLKDISYVGYLPKNADRVWIKVQFSLRFLVLKFELL